MHTNRGGPRTIAIVAQSHMAQGSIFRPVQLFEKTFRGNCGGTNKEYKKFSQTMVISYFYGDPRNGGARKSGYSTKSRVLFLECVYLPR